MENRGAGCQRRFPVRTARSMDCSSEPGVIAAGLPAASFARRGRAGADRSHRAVPSLHRQLRSLGRHARAAADKTVTTGEDRAYAFTTDDFGFVDADAGDTLASGLGACL